MSPTQAPALPTLPATPSPPPMYGQNNEAGMRQKKAATAQANAFGSFLGTNATPSQGQSGQKTLLGQ